MAANRGALDAMKNDSGTRKTTSAVYDGKKVDADKGLEALFVDPETGKRQHRGLTRYSLDERGELTGSAESTYAQSVHLQSAYLDALKGEKAFNTADVSKGIERLYNAAKKKKEEEGHGIPIAKGFLDTLSTKFVDKLKSEGKLKTVPYHRVVRKKEDIDYTIEDADPTAMATKAFANKAILDATGLGGVSDTIASVEGAAVGATTGAIGAAAGGPASSAVGAVLGGGTGYLLGGAMNSKWYRGAKEGARGLWNKWTTNDYRIEYERGAGESKEDTKYLLEITPEGIQDIANFLTNGGYFDKIGESQANIDIKDKGFTDSIRSTFTSIADVNIKDLKKELNNARAKVKRTGNGFDYTPQHIEDKIIRAERARNGVDDTDLQELYRGIDELNEVEKQHKEQENEYWSNSRMASAGNNTLGLLGFETQKLDSTQKSRAKYAMTRLMREGLNKEQAAGIVGNMLKESSLNPKSGAVDSNGKWAGGIVGWNGSNYEAAKKYFGGRDLKNVSFEDQLEYLIKEMKGEAGAIRAVERSGYLKKHGFKDGDNVMDVMKTTTSLQDSTNTFERIFEGSGDFAGYWANKGKPNAKFHEGDKNKKRLNLAATVYEQSGGNLSNAGLTEDSDENYGGHMLQEVVVTGKNKSKEAKSFLEIFKEKVTDLIMNFGGAFSNITDKIEDTILPKEKKRYTGPITKEFKSFNDYKANEDNLPAALPKGMSETEWRKKVIDLTGSMPIDLKLTETAEKIKEEKKTEEPKKELRKDSEGILNKYSKWGENEIPQYKSDFMKNAEDERYRKLIPYLNDPVLRNQLTADEISNIERVKREDELNKTKDKPNDDYYRQMADHLDLNDPEVLKNLSEDDLKNIERVRKEAAMKLEVMDDPGKYRQMAKLMEDPVYKATLTDEDLEKIKIVQEMDKTSALTTPTPTIDISEEEKSRLVALANDPGTRGMLSPDDLAKVQKIEEAEGKTLAKAPEATPTEEDKVLHESSSFLSMFDPKNFEKKEDKIVTIVDLVTNTNDMLGKILSVNSINGTTSAHIVDAVNKNTVTSANASMNLARASFAQQKNSVGKVPSLTETDKSTIKGLA
jgi:hypothetical protein